MAPRSGKAETIEPARRADLVQRFHEERRPRREAEETIAAALGCDAGEIIVYCPALTVMKEAAARVATGGGWRRLNDSQLTAFAEIRALENLYANLWRLYVFVPAEVAERTAAAATELFGHASEYVPR